MKVIKFLVFEKAKQFIFSISIQLNHLLIIELWVELPGTYKLVLIEDRGEIRS